MEVSAPQQKTGSSEATSRAKHTRRSVPLKREPKPEPVMDGDQAIRVFINELKKIGYPIEIVNFENDAGDLTAAISLPGKVWTEKAELIEKVQTT